MRDCRCGSLGGRSLYEDDRRGRLDDFVGARVPRGRRCDPHRPRMAGAATGAVVGSAALTMLRSSPTPDGRCCSVLSWSDACCHCVAILTDPGGPVLLALCREPRAHIHVAILTDPGWPVLRPAGTTAGGLLPGVAILTDPGWPVLLEWHTCGNRRHARRCDPHRPRMAGAAGNFAIARTAAGGVAILIDPGGPVLRLMTIKYTG